MWGFQDLQPPQKFLSVPERGRAGERVLMEANVSVCRRGLTCAGAPERSTAGCPHPPGALPCQPRWWEGGVGGWMWVCGSRRAEGLGTHAGRGVRGKSALTGGPGVRYCRTSLRASEASASSSRRGSSSHLPTRVTVSSPQRPLRPL